MTDPHGPGETAAASRAQRGMEHLEAYELGLDDADLAVALEELTAATEDGGDHPDLPFWCYARSIAHAYRCDEGTPEDAALAIAWGERAFEGAGPGTVDRGTVAVMLGDYYWGRYAEQRDEPGAAQHLDVLVDALARIQVDDADPYVRDNLRMMLGAAYAERFTSGEARADLDMAIACLAPTVDDLPAGIPELAAGALALCTAYYRRSELDEDPKSIDLAVEIAERTAARLDPREPRVINLRWSQYLMLSLRLERAEDHRDRDEAIRCLRHAADLSEQPDPELAMALSELLIDRGELYQDADDLAAAALWAGVATNLDPDGDDSWYPRLSQCVAFLMSWEMFEDADDAGRLVDALTGMIDAGTPDRDMLLMAHRYRLGAQIELDRRRVAAGEVEESDALAARAAMVEAAHQAVRGEPGEDGQMRSRLAGMVLGQLVKAVGSELLTPDTVDLRGLLVIAREHPVDNEQWPHMLAIAESAIGMYEARDGAEGGDYGLPALVEALRMPEFDTETTGELRRMVSMAKYMRGTHTGDMRDLDSAMSGLYQAHKDAAGNPALAQHLEMMQSFAVLARTSSTSSTTLLGTQSAEALASIAGDGSTADVSGRYLDALLRVQAAPGGERAAAGFTAMFDAMANGTASATAGLFGYQMHQLMQAVLCAARCVPAYATGVPAEMEAAGRAFVEAVDAVSRSQPVRGDLLVLGGSLAFSLLEHHPDPVIEDAAQRWARESVQRCRQPSDRMWASARLNLARWHRRRGRADDLAESRAYGLAAMHGRTWQIVLQSGVDYGLQAARRQADDVRMVTRWCHADAVASDAAGRGPILADLVQALDAGRGMVLGVAAAGGAIHDALVARGKPELAAEWLAGDRLDGPDALFDLADLRHRVVSGLAQDADDVSLLAPVTVEEIGAALAGSRRDILVYLVAGDETGPGFAVLVPADGAVELLPLPALRADDSPLGWYLHTFHGAQVLAGGDLDVWRWSLSQLSAWAWRAAMGALVERCRELVPDRPPRLVLIPTGMLAIVPWHAAWRLVGRAERRYAVQDVAVSYAPSARMWCETVRRPPVTSGASLVIGDPTGDLPSGVDEAVAVHRAFYSDGGYLGQPGAMASGAGTPAEVRGWLAAADAPPAAVLHVACHGVVDAERPAQSHLRLAGGALRADDLIRLSVGHRRIGTVVLAACTTNVGGTEYDEALTLSTAFLVAGAASVVGSMWAVPSASTGLMMYMLHHFLREAPDDPGEALHRAQLWMLDPGRRLPEGASALVRQVNLDRLVEPYRWAGFTHLGR
ncbi:CHAT domain-containing protein [Dactylosporangium sp. NPDC000521]|uniref:CHAT domain-containing protein n=1 Tax=Dactylosporangium sp. NPDC000521 TaxID=3363975 RepID=UPI00367765B9